MSSRALLAMVFLAACHPSPTPSPTPPPPPRPAQTATTPTCGPDTLPPPVEGTPASFVDEAGLLRSVVASDPGTARWGTCDHEEVLTSLRPLMRPPRQALRRAEPLAREILTALLAGDHISLAENLHPDRGLLLRAGSSEPCLVLAKSDVAQCATSPRLLHCDTTFDPAGPAPALCAPYVRRLLRLDALTSTDRITADCTSSSVYVVRPDLLPTGVDGHPLVPLVLHVHPAPAPYPNLGLVMTLVEEDGRLYLHDLTPAEVAR